MFIFLLTPFDTRDCYYLVSELSLVKLLTLFYSFLKIKKDFCPVNLFLYVSGISFGRCCRKSVAKSKKDKKMKEGKKGDGHIRGLSIEWDSNLLHTMISREKSLE